MNEKFFALPQERQEQIINAAYEMFSRDSYKYACRLYHEKVRKEIRSCC